MQIRFIITAAINNSSGGYKAIQSLTYVCTFSWIQGFIAGDANMLN